MKKALTKFIPFLIMASFFVTGCNQDTSSTTTAAKPAINTKAKKREGLVYKGKVVGKSHKAKSISIVVGKGENAKTVMVKFDDKTKGVEHAAKGHASIIYYEMRNGQPLATVIKPKLAKLPKGVTEIETAELKSIINSKADFTLIDARPKKRYVAAHLPSAKSISTEAYKKIAPSILPEDKDKLLLMYCGGPTCGMSTKVAGWAAKDGYNNIRVYLQGQPAWRKAGNMVYASNKNISERNIILIDLRSKKKSAAGRIARSVTIPYDSLDDRLDDIPRKAHIVLYSDSAEEAREAVTDLRDEGFKKVALVEGNYAGWIKAGGKTVKGPVVTDINWKRKHGKNEVSKAEFLKAVSGVDTSAVILDVRTDNETSAGGFKNAIAVPLDQISSRLDEIPMDKKIYTHCATGVRADMAAQELKKNGYNAFFLVASIECEGNDCKIED